MLMGMDVQSGSQESVSTYGAKGLPAYGSLVHASPRCDIQGIAVNGPTMACSSSSAQGTGNQRSTGKYLLFNDNLHHELKESQSSRLSERREMAEVPEAETDTTMMLRNIPFEVDLDELVCKIEAAGFGDCYDMLYLPMKRGNAQNRGFAFLNFKNPIFVCEFKAAFHKQNTTWASHSRKNKMLNVTGADVQGFMETINLVRSQSSASQLEKQLLVKV